jgi:hypothetical protein
MGARLYGGGGGAGEGLHREKGSRHPAPVRTALANLLNGVFTQPE